MKLQKHIFIVTAFTLINLFIWSSSGYAYGDYKNACSTLSRIDAIDIVFDWDGKGMLTPVYNSTKDILQAFVVQKLREDGIKIQGVHSCESIDTIEKRPFLYVEMHTYKCRDDEHTVFLDVKFFQEVSIKEDQSKSFISPTWSAGGTISISPISSFPDLLEGILEKFVSAYKSVNRQTVADYSQSDRKTELEGGE